MRTRLGMLFAGLCICLASRPAWAAGAVRGLPLPQVIKQSDLIVLVSVESYTPDPKALADIAALKASGSQSNLALLASTTIRAEGNYKFKKLLAMKGDCDAELNLKLLGLTWEVFGVHEFKLPENAQAILFLKKNGTQWEAVDPVMPYVPLIANADAAIKSLPSAREKTPDTIDAILSSLGDAALRPALLGRLRDVEDQRLVKALHPYMNEQDAWARECVLYSLAVQQDLQAIPPIAEMTRDAEKQFPGIGGGPADALKFYKKPEAIPLLNPLVVDGPNYLRRSAILALCPIADESSIPFLIQALDHGDISPYPVYDAFHRIVSAALPPAISLDEYRADKDKEIQALKQWWNAEQARRKTSTTQTAPQNPNP